MLQKRKSISLLKEMAAMDQAMTEEEQYKMAPRLLKAMAEYAGAENIILYRKKERGFDDYLPVMFWNKQGENRTLIEEIDLTEYPVMQEYFKKKEPFMFSGVEQMEKEAVKESALFNSTGLQSVIFIPILALKEICGFLKLDNVSLDLSEESLEILNSIATHWGAIHAGMRMLSLETERSNNLKEVLSIEKKYSEVMSALSKIYWQIYSVDLENDTYKEVFNGKKFDKDAIYHIGITTDDFHNTLQQFISKEYRSIMDEFLNHDTLPDRLKDTDTIAIEYLANNNIWLSARYIVQDRNEDGEVTHALFTIRSVNEHKQKEVQYQKKLKEIAEEAKKASVAKTDFLRRMSHDLRTPINGIRGMLTISERNIDDIEKIKECHKKIWRASDYLLNLINDVLDMNRLESGQLSLEQKAFDMKDIWRDIDDVIGTQANEKGIEIVAGAYKIEHTKVIGSPLYLKQILMNIGNNAVKYTNAGGKITISCVEKQLTDQNTSYYFVIADTGIGMSPEFQEHAYEVFSQEKSQVARGYVGTGLGLAITKQLVDLLNGKIEFTSKQGKGTTFVIELPFKLDFSKEDSMERGEEASCDLNGKKFLLVEDNELNMEISKYILEEEGATVDTALDGKQAVEQFSKSQEGEYCLILMDIMMPVMNGYEATKIIRKMDRADAKSIPIFAMSANAFPEDIKESIKAGMNRHLSKPLEIDHFLKEVYSVMKG